jgi:hypothetical protein
MSYIVIFSDRFYPFLPTTNKTKEKRTRKKKLSEIQPKKQRRATSPQTVSTYFIFLGPSHNGCDGRGLIDPLCAFPYSPAIDVRNEIFNEGGGRAHQPLAL